MSVTTFLLDSGFYDSQNGDRRYSAEDMTKPYGTFIKDGIFGSAGSESLEVGASSPAGMSVEVKAGNAMLLSRWVEAESKTFTVPANSDSNPRIDSVILRVSTNAQVRAAHLIYITGLPAASPVAPSLDNTSDTKEVRLANVAVASGATSITSTEITDTRGGNDCPWAQLDLEYVGIANFENMQF